MKIAIFTTSISLGGISSYLINFTNYLVECGHTIHLFYTDIAEDKKDSLNKGITLVRYNCPNPKSFKSFLFYLFCGGILSALRIKFRKRNKIAPMKDNQRIAYIQAKMTKTFCGDFDVVISSAEFYCNYVVSMKFNCRKKIAWVHPDLSMLDIDKKLSAKMMRFFDNICVVSDSCYLSFVNIFPEFAKKTLVIENIIDQDAILEKSKENINKECFQGDKIKLITVCRFDNSSKRIDRIIELCKILKEKKVNFVWNLVGEGPDLSYLERLSDTYNLSDVVNFLGPKNNPYPYIANSDVFVLSSQYEGKPIVVDEALALHVPCIVTNYKSASNQVNSMFGAVLENDDNLFQASFLRTLNCENLTKWKSALSEYKVDNSYIKRRIQELVD